MENQVKKKNTWQYPWGYLESSIIAGGIILIGFLLQLTLGSFNFYLLIAPVNLYFGIAILFFCISTVFFRKNNFFKWFSGIPFSVVLLISLLFLTIIMGLTPQIAGTEIESKSIFDKLGFTQMTRSWSFVLVYFVTLLSLGSLIARRLYHFSFRDYGFYFNHIGLWIVLFAAGFGYADIERYVMHVQEGEVEWRVFDDNNNVKELPIAIHLIDFDMEEYAPKLTVIDRKTGEPQPVSNPDFYQIDEKEKKGKLFGWNLQVEEYIHQAVRSSDSTYREVPMEGATPAIKITMVNPKNNEKTTGWVCGGNMAQLYMTLPLDSLYTVVMTQTEPKRFVSEVEIFINKGEKREAEKYEAEIEVNKPFAKENWTVYQYGYDDKMGRLSSYSSFELVYDPWKNSVFAGFLFIAIGTIVMIWNGKQLRKKYEKSEE